MTAKATIAGTYIQIKHNINTDTINLAHLKRQSFISGSSFMLSGLSRLQTRFTVLENIRITGIFPVSSDTAGGGDSYLSLALRLEAVDSAGLSFHKNWKKTTTLKALLIQHFSLINLQKLYSCKLWTFTCWRCWQVSVWTLDRRKPAVFHCFLPLC